MGINISRISARAFFLDVRVIRHGKEVRKRETFTGTQAEAEERFYQIKKELRESASELSKKVTCFREVLEKYRERRLSLGGLDKTRFNCLHRDLGEVPIPHLPEKFGAYIRRLRDEPWEHTKRCRTNGTLNRYVTMARAAFNHAIELGLVTSNPISKARFPKFKEVPRDQVLEDEKRDRLLEVVTQEAPHLLPILRFSLQVPCRKSELVNMRKEDLDLTHNAIRVRNGTTKNDKGVWKPIPPDMVDYFRSIPPECPWVFFKARKGLFCPLGDFKVSWRKCLKLAGITNFHFHDTRHMSASALLDNGTPEQVVLEVAGWKTNMLRTYYHRAGKKSLSLVRFKGGVGQETGHFSAEEVSKLRETAQIGTNGGLG